MDAAMLPSTTTAKIRKVGRACDGCRRRKTKCDGPKLKGSCSNCLAARKSCTYLEASTPRGPPKAYVTALEDRLEHLEELLKQVRPDTDFTPELGPPIPRDSWKEDSAAVPSTSRVRSQPNTLRLKTGLALNPRSRHDSDSSSDDFSSSDSEHVVEGLYRGRLRLALHSTHDREDYDAINARFHGKSSLGALIEATRRYKEMHISDAVQADPRESKLTTPDTPVSASFKRPAFWLAHPWELQWEGLQVDTDKLLLSVIEEFPPPALAAELIDLYFVHINSQLPLLHRPTFERQFRDGRHHHNIWFSCVCLGMFATASRWCNDPLVLPRDCPRTSSGALDWTSAGWHYHTVAMGIHRIRQSLLYPACLEEIQTYSLLAAFLRGTANHPSGWMFVSIGLRKAQDVGAHRRKVYASQPSIEEELWKKAVWCLISYDRFGSAILGRTCAVGEEDFDLEPVLEVDDEYWETEPPFYQPPNVPCRVTSFNLWLRLSQIVTYTVKTIYAVHNPRALLGRIAKVRTDEVIAQLTRALQDWRRSVPKYLQWSNDIEDDELSNQSATLYTTYYLAEMLIYRAFIPPVSSAPAPAPSTPHIPASFPALSYCITAARSSARIVEVQLARSWTNIPTLIAVSQLSAAILTLGIWDCKAKQQQDSEDIKPPLAHTIATLLDDVGIFIGALEWAAGRWENCTTLIRVLKKALPKDEIVRPNPPRPRDRRMGNNLSPTSSHLHPSADKRRVVPEQWSPPALSSRHDDSPSFADARPRSYMARTVQRDPTWDSDYAENTASASGSYPRPSFDDLHLYP